MRLNRKEFAEIIGYSERHVSRLIADGMPVLKHTGRRRDPVEIDPAQAVPWMIERARERAERDGEPELERLHRERADGLALSNAREREQLIYRRHVADFFVGLDRILARVLNGLTWKEAKRMAGKDQRQLYQLLLQDGRDRRRRIAEGVDKMKEAMQTNA